VRDFCKLNVHTLQALVRNFILMDMSELILKYFAQKRKRVITSAVQEMKIAKIVYR
jgi:hypothetical protein